MLRYQTRYFHVLHDGQSNTSRTRQNKYRFPHHCFHWPAVAIRVCDLVELSMGSARQRRWRKPAHPRQHLQCQLLDDFEVDVGAAEPLLNPACQTCLNRFNGLRRGPAWLVNLADRISPRNRLSALE